MRGVGNLGVYWLRRADGVVLARGIRGLPVMPALCRWWVAGGRVLGQAVLLAPCVNASGFGFGCLLPARVRGDRVGHGGLGGECFGESGDLEDAQDARGC